jgi:hypothetical protein
MPSARVKAQVGSKPGPRSGPKKKRVVKRVYEAWYGTKLTALDTMMPYSSDEEDYEDEDEEEQEEEEDPYDLLQDFLELVDLMEVENRVAAERKAQALVDLGDEELLEEPEKIPIITDTAALTTEEYEAYYALHKQYDLDKAAYDAQQKRLANKPIEISIEFWDFIYDRFQLFMREWENQWVRYIENGEIKIKHKVRFMDKEGGGTKVVIHDPTDADDDDAEELCKRLTYLKFCHGKMMKAAGTNADDNDDDHSGSDTETEQAAKARSHAKNKNKNKTTKGRANSAETTGKAVNINKRTDLDSLLTQPVYLPTYEEWGRAQEVGDIHPMFRYIRQHGIQKYFTDYDAEVEEAIGDVGGDESGDDDGNEETIDGETVVEGEEKAEEQPMGVGMTGNQGAA